MEDTASDEDDAAHDDVICGVTELNDDVDEPVAADDVAAEGSDVDED